MSEPPENRAAALARNEDGLDVEASEAGENVITNLATRKKHFTLAEVKRLEFCAAVLFLGFLPRTPRPRTGAAKLKHIAEATVPTVTGYVSEDTIKNAADCLGIKRDGGDIAVRVPKPSRSNLTRRGGR